MKLFLRRGPSSANATIGELFIENSNERICYVLEDPVREVEGQSVESWKVPGRTAIPRGEYRVIITYSPRFERRLPLLVDVPGFSGIRFHSGNKPTDTEGCLLPGFDRTEETVLNSRAAFSSVYRIIEEALLAGEPVRINVS